MTKLTKISGCYVFNIFVNAFQWKILEGFNRHRPRKDNSRHNQGCFKNKNTLQQA